MKRQGMCAVVFVVLLAASVQAAIPSVLPEISLQVSPENPDSSDTLSLTLSGTWPDSCVPEEFEVLVVSGDSIWIDLFLPGWNAKGDCPQLMCLQVLTPWELAQDLEPLSPGQYDVFLRAIACEETGSYQQIAGFRVESGATHFTSGRFARGERLVLLQDDPPGGIGLKAGRAGTVVCCDPNDCSGGILVSWDLWADGKIELLSCKDAVAAIYPFNSAIWIDPSQVLVGRQFSQCGTIRKGLEGCVYFESDDGDTYNVMAPAELYVALDDAGAIQFDDHVRLRGLLNTTPPGPGEISLCPQRNGDIFHPVISLCPTATTACCDGAYQSGDRVQLLVDDPVGPGGQAAAGPLAGSVGTVVCCNGDDPLFPILVSWDKWAGGGKVDTAPCESQAVSYPDNSLWWMACDQIAPIKPDEPGSEPDEIVINLGGNPLVLKQDSLDPHSYTGCVTLSLELNYKAKLSVQIIPTAGVSGTWTGTLSPDEVGPGEVTTNLCVQVEDLDFNTLPPGKNVHVATVTILAVPAV